MLKTIPIFAEDIITKQKYMCDMSGRQDLMGQILSSGYGVKVHPRSKSPADQNTIVHPFSIWVRDHAHNTPLTLEILKNSQIYDSYKQIEVANTILEEHDIYLEIQ